MISMPLNPGAIEVWTFDLLTSDEQVESAYDLLSMDERLRADRFHFPADRRRFVVGRASLRRVLGSYLETTPGRLEFEYSEYGKPKLSSPNTSLRFNASRSGERALIACTSEREIGIDIERIRVDLEVEDLAQRFFSAAENKKMRAIPADFRHLAFLRCWTCKEACAKAMGTGLSLDPRKLDVSVVLNNPGVPAVANEVFVVNGLTLLVLEPHTSGYLSALAIEPGEFTIKVHPISDDR